MKTSSASTSDGFSVNILQIDAAGNANSWYPNGTMKLVATGGTQIGLNM